MNFADFDFYVEGLKVYFTDRSDDGGGITSYSWNFGDGSLSTATNPMHTYMESGEYIVTLTIYDIQGMTDIRAKSVTVMSSSGQCDVPVWNRETSYEIDDRVKHNGGLYVATWWNHGADPEVFSNVWKKEGTCSDIPNDKIQSKFSYIDTGWLVKFASESISEKEIETYEWDFGDGSDASFFGKTAVKLYDQDGTYTVTLKVIDVDGNFDSSFQQVTVKLGNPAPVADFTYTIENMTINLQSTSTDNSSIASHEWVLGDGNLATGESVAHTYGKGGQYTIVLKVTDDEGISAEKALSIVVGEPIDIPPTAIFSFVADNLQVDFTDLSVDDVGITHTIWNFGDGSSSDEKDPTHDYTAAGSYQVQLIVTDTAGLTDSSSQTVIVEEGSNCNAEPWSSSVIYWAGDRVSQNSKIYEAKWYSDNQSPVDYSGQWEVWKLVGDCI